MAQLMDRHTLNSGPIACMVQPIPDIPDTSLSPGEDELRLPPALQMGLLGLRERLQGGFVDGDGPWRLPDFGFQSFLGWI